MIFPCTKCGLCCQNISSIPELKDYDLGTGICKYFDSITNGCEIYENRPLICRVDKMFDLKYHKFYPAVTEQCYLLRQNHLRNPVLISYRICMIPDVKPYF